MLELARSFKPRATKAELTDAFRKCKEVDYQGKAVVLAENCEVVGLLNVSGSIVLDTVLSVAEGLPKTKPWGARSWGQVIPLGDILDDEGLAYTLYYVYKTDTLYAYDYKLDCFQSCSIFQQPTDDEPALVEALRRLKLTNRIPS